MYVSSRRNYLEVGSYCLLAFLALVGEQIFVALDTERLVIAQDVAMSGQIQRTVEACQHIGDFCSRRRLHHSPLQTQSINLHVGLIQCNGVMAGKTGHFSCCGKFTFF